MGKYMMCVVFGLAMMTGSMTSSAAAPGYFPNTLSLNTTGFPDSIFLGRPDGNDINRGWILLGEMVIYDFGNSRVVDGPGPDFNVYERDAGGAEFDAIDVLVSKDGNNFVSVKNTEGLLVRIGGDENHAGGSFAHSYDLSLSGLQSIRFIRIDGLTNIDDGMDLDAVGAINFNAGGGGTPGRGGIQCTLTVSGLQMYYECNGTQITQTAFLPSEHIEGFMIPGNSVATWALTDRPVGGIHSIAYYANDIITGTRFSVKQITQTAHFPSEHIDAFMISGDSVATWALIDRPAGGIHSIAYYANCIDIGHMIPPLKIASADFPDSIRKFTIDINTGEISWDLCSRNSCQSFSLPVPDCF